MDLMNQFMNCHQKKTENVQEFVKRFYKLSEKALESVGEEKKHNMLVQCFIEGIYQKDIQTELIKQLAVKPDVSVEPLIKTAIKLEKSSIQRSERKQSISSSDSELS